MSELEKLINELTEEDIEYLEKTVFTEDGGIIPLNELDKLISYEAMMHSQKDAVQYALKINLNSVYGVQIMPHFKFADEYGSLGASTTLSGRILSKFGLIETIEQYFNQDREIRWEFPLSNDITVAADDISFFKNPENQMLRTAVISDTDSVSGDSLVKTDRFGDISLTDLEEKADRIEIKNNKEFYFFDSPLNITNYIDGNLLFDTVEFIYAHNIEKDMYEIELEDGKIIRCTSDHSIMICNDCGEPIIEKKPNELTSDDFCMIED